MHCFWCHVESGSLTLKEHEDARWLDRVISKYIIDFFSQSCFDTSVVSFCVVLRRFQKTSTFVIGLFPPLCVKDIEISENMDIIIFGSLHGATKRYAERLAEMTGIKAVDYKDLKDAGPFDRVIYMGAIYARGVVGLKKTLGRITSAKELFIVTVGMVDPEDKVFFDSFREALKAQVPAQLFDEKKLFHLRGAMMPEEQLTPEFKAVLATYGQTVDFVDFGALKPVAAAVMG